jgi:hypothetical protein
MALWHMAEMSYIFGGSLSWSVSAAFVWMCVAFFISGGSSLLAFGLGAVRLAVFLRRVMRFICRVSDLVMGGVIWCYHPWERVEPLVIFFFAKR